MFISEEHSLKTLESQLYEEISWDERSHRETSSPSGQEEAWRPDEIQSEELQTEESFRPESEMETHSASDNENNTARSTTDSGET